MKTHLQNLAASSLLTLLASCTVSVENEVSTDSKAHFEKEKAAIIATLNNETKAAFTRDYEAWKENCIASARNIQKPYEFKRKCSRFFIITSAREERRRRKI